MARESSAKKVAKVARTGRRRTPGQPRRLGFPALVAGIILVGSLLVFVARGERESTAGESPRLNVATSEGGIQGDHWHMPYGVWRCDTEEWEPVYVDVRGDEVGIHTHADGFIHVHPTSNQARGSRATLELFFDEVGVDASDDEWELPDGTVLADGDECADGSEGEWRIFKWDSLDDDEPEEFTGGFDRIRFRQDGEVYTMAFAPGSYEPELPPTARSQEEPTDLEVDDEGNVVSPELDPADDGAGTTEAPADDGAGTTEAPADGGADTTEAPADGDGDGADG